MPEVTRCRRCGSAPSAASFLDQADLGIVCEKCSGGGRRMLDIGVRDMITNS
jgi:DNA-directed RNA polymerase subunit RPC12/RpoP